MKPVAPARGLNPVRQVLDNGIVAAVQTNVTAPAVAINLTFDAGSIHEPECLPGLAYLAGQMIDRGTRGRPPERIAEELDDRGVVLRVSVTRHTLTVATISLAEDLSAVLELIADIVRNPTFQRDQLDKRRAEAITSVLQDADNTAVRATEDAMALLYGGGHPYARPPKGTVSTLEAMDSADLEQFHRRRMVPGALRIAIAGDVQPEATLEAVGGLFADWTGGLPGDETVPAPPAQRRQTAFTQMPGKPQADIAYGFTAVRRSDPRYYAYSIMNGILGQFGLGGRLANSIREDQGMAYYAFSTFDGTVGEGPLLIRAGVDPANVTRTLDAIDREVELLAREGPSPLEVEETRSSLIGSIPRLLETNEGIAEFLQTAEQFELGLDYDRRLAERFEEVAIDDVRRAAKELLDTTRAAYAVAGPGSGS